MSVKTGIRVGRAWPLLLESSSPVLAVLAALLIGAVLIRAGGASVWEAYQGLFEGMLGSKQALSETCVAATPYIFLGLAVALGFQGGLFNIGAEGQFYMGALFSVMVGFSDLGLPGWLHVSLAVTAGAAGGLLWGAVPGFLKARLGAHEVINTIMMNYIAISLVDYLVKNLIRDPGASMDRTPNILAAAHLPRFFGSDYRLHVGFILALIAVFLVRRLLFSTTWGYEFRTVGSNPGAARYAGMNVGRTMVLIMALSGGLAGLAGAGEVLGLKHNLPAAFSRGYGFDSIAVALLAKSNPYAVLPAAFLWGGLRNGAGLMQIRSGISIDLINIIQALVIIFIAADPVARWVLRFRPGQKARAVFTRGWGR